MNILGIGAPELILIFMIAIVVAGPKRMIRWAYLLGVYVGKLRAMWADVAKVIQAEVDAAGLDVKVPTDIPTRADVGRMIQQASKPLADPINKAAQEMTDDMRRVQKDMTASIKTPSVADVTKDVPPAKPAALPTPAPSAAPADLGSWGAAAKPSANGAETSDFGTWGARSEAQSTEQN